MDSVRSGLGHFSQLGVGSNGGGVSITRTTWSNNKGGVVSPKKPMGVGGNGEDKISSLDSIPNSSRTQSVGIHLRT